MSNDKNKPKERTGFTKAGRNSKSGGQRKSTGRGVNSNEPDLFTRLLQDKREEQKSRREEAKQQSITRQNDFRIAQAKLAKSLLNMPNGTTRDVAELIINNFVVVMPNQGGVFIEPGTDKKISRTTFAELQIVEQMTPQQLKNQFLVNNARFGARKVLNMAFEQLKSAAATEESSTPQAVMA